MALMRLLVAALAVACIQGQEVKDAEGNRVYLPGEAGDDGTKEGLFGSYYDVPFLNSAGETVATVNMQLAITADEDHHGLMFRDSMPDEKGMLFLYKDSQQRVLYMRNTLIDLDAGWMSPDGSLLEVQKLNKMDETWRWSASHNVQWGLEMNVGWFAANNVKPGDHLDMSAVALAIQARGFEPVHYGLQANTPEQAAAGGALTRKEVTTEQSAAASSPGISQESFLANVAKNSERRRHEDADTMDIHQHSALGNFLAGKQ